MTSLKRIGIGTARMAAQGTIGWVTLITLFEAAYWADAYITHLRRKG